MTTQTRSTASALLFDDHRGRTADDWQRAASTLTESQVLWVDLGSAGADDAGAVRAAFALEDGHPAAITDGEAEPRVSLHDGYIHVTTLIAPRSDHREDDPGDVLDAYIGDNWVVTVHRGDSPLIDDFRELASGGGQLGALDAPSFLATLLELVVVSYSEAFAEIESMLEEFDANVLNSPDGDVEEMVAILVDARQRVGGLRRSLAPHRRIFATLAHSELDLVSTERSAERFRHLAERVDAALVEARDAKDAVVNSFDMLILRTEHRTNEIVKVLTLTSILLLPGALIAALMGMNVNIAASEFTHSGIFWAVLIMILGIAAATVALARTRRWI